MIWGEPAVHEPVLSPNSNSSDMVAAFVKATLAGWRSAHGDPQGALGSVMKRGQNLDREQQLWMLEQSIAALADKGRMTGAKWGEAVEVLKAGGLPNAQPEPPDSYFTNTFVP